MSGGFWDYSHFKVSSLADDIEKTFKKEGKYLVEDYSFTASQGSKRNMIEADYLEEADEETRIVFLGEVRKLVRELRRASAKAKALDWFLSGDTSLETCLKEFEDLSRQRKFD